MNALKNIMTVFTIVTLLSILVYPQQPTNIAVTTSGNQRETAITVDPNNQNHLMATWNEFNGRSLPAGLCVFFRWR